MNNAIIQLLVLAGVAIFLILKLRAVLGTRDGFEGGAQPPAPTDPALARQGATVIDSGPDHDIIDNVAAGSADALALEQMKRVEPQFNVSGFLQGARGAYEMILTSFADGNMDRIRPFMSSDVAEGFDEVVADRKARGLKVTTTVQGIRELAIHRVEFDRATSEAEIAVRFVTELTSETRDAGGQLVEGDARATRKQRDIWTFARTMGAKDPNWQLVATGE